MLVTTILLLASQGSLDTRVDYAPDACRLEIVCQDLTRKLGVTIKPEKALKDEVMAIAVGDVTGKALLDKIAEVLDASVLKSGREFVIAQTAEQKKACERKETALRRKAVSDNIRDIVDEAKLGHDFGAEQASALALKVRSNWLTRDKPGNWAWDTLEYDAESPGYRLLARVIQSLPIDQLVALPDSERIVFSDHPNKMQLQLKADIRPALESFATEQQRYAESITKTDAKPTVNITTNFASDFVKPVAKPVAKLLIAVSRDAAGQISFRISGFDESRDRLFNFSSMSASSRPKAGPPAANILNADEDISFEQDALTKEYRATVVEAGGFSDLRTPSKALRQRLINLDKTDYLGFGLNQVVATLRSQAHLQVVANANERASYWLVRQSRELKNSLRAAESNLVRAGHTLSRKDGWWTLKQNDPLRNRQIRADRTLLADFLRRMATRPCARLMDVAQLAAAIPPQVSMEFFTPILYSVLPVAPPRIDFKDSWWRFYGLLSPRQLELVSAFKPIPIPDLTEAQLSALYRVVYQDDTQWSWNFVGQPQFDADGKLVQRFLDEPTELVPNGLTPDMAVTTTTMEEAAAVSEGPVTQYGRGVSGIIELAFEALRSERPELSGEKGPGVQPNPQRRFLAARKSLWALTIQAAPTASKTSNLVDVYDVTGGYVTLDHMPPAFRTELEAMKKRLREQNQNPGGQPAKKNPPPR